MPFSPAIIGIPSWPIGMPSMVSVGSMPMSPVPGSNDSMLIGLSSATEGAAALGMGSRSLAFGPADAAGTPASSSAPTCGCCVITDGMPSMFIAMRSIRGRDPGVAA